MALPRGLCNSNQISLLAESLGNNGSIGAQKEFPARPKPILDPSRKLHNTGQSGRARLAERGDDLYQTPPEATRALLRVENLPRHVWEPACGPGAIVNVLREAGHAVVATDLRSYGCPDSEGCIDFLMERRAPAGVEAVITNPPYKLAGEFVQHALTLVPRVYMLLRLAFLESERRSVILDNGQLARVHIFKRRLPFMHREGWTGPQANSAIAFAWSSGTSTTPVPPR